VFVQFVVKHLLTILQLFKFVTMVFLQTYDTTIL